jgi:hypothetical protein
VRARRTPAAARLLSHGLPVRVRCSERCTVRLLMRRRGRMLSLPVRVSLVPGVSKWVVLRLNRAGRARLGRSRALALALVARATDAAGNRRTLNIGMRTRR